MKIDRKIATRITSDWLTVFPGMVQYKPMELLRRIGPLLMGVALQKNSANDAYYPTFHIHNIANEIDIITSTIGQRLVTKNSVQERIHANQHDGRWAEAAQRLRNQVDWPLEGDLTLDFVIERYNADEAIRRPFLSPLEDRISLNSWCGRVDEANAYLDAGREAILKWPKDVLDRMIKYQEFDIDTWYSKMKGLANNPELVRAQVERSIEVFKVRKLPESRLICQ